MEFDTCPGCDGQRERLHNDGLMHVCTLCSGTGDVLDEETAVQKLGEKIGYGRVMQLAELLWSKKVPGGAHSVGPCLRSLVPCLCDYPVICDWCEGSGRVTKRVMQAMKEATKVLRLPR